jgi:hypothetical protein
MVEAEKPTNLIWRSHEVEQRTMRYRRGSILQSSQEAGYRQKVEITITYHALKRAATNMRLGIPLGREGDDFKDGAFQLRVEAEDPGGEQGPRTGPF